MLQLTYQLLVSDASSQQKPQLLHYEIGPGQRNASSKQDVTLADLEQHIRACWVGSRVGAQDHR